MKRKRKQVKITQEDIDKAKAEYFKTGGRIKVITEDDIKDSPVFVKYINSGSIETGW